MTKLALPIALLTALASVHIASGALIISASAPTDDILSSNPTGTTYTRLFDEDLNSNHARGQLFALPTAGGLGYEITAITVMKNGNQTFANDTLTMRVFEGTAAQWDTGTGHSTAIDGNDYYVDTTVTPLYTEAFTINGLVSGGQFVTFELATPLAVNENSDFGFLMTYDESAATSPNYFQHNESGTGGGRISITTTDHGYTLPDSRAIRYYVQGTTVVPEPSSALLFGLACFTLLAIRRK